MVTTIAEFDDLQKANNPERNKKPSSKRPNKRTNQKYILKETNFDA